MQTNNQITLEQMKRAIVDMHNIFN